MGDGTATMRAMVLWETGGLEHLHIEDLPVPVPSGDEVLVRVHTVGANHQDLFAIRGKANIATLELPHVLGNDPAGTVAALGPDVDGLAPGDRVLVKPTIACETCSFCLAGEDDACLNLRIVGVHRRGGHAEYLPVPARNVFPIPSGLGFAEATALAQTFPVALTMLRDRAEVGPEDVVLVSGAAGAVGSAAVQLALSFGARVIAAVGSVAGVDHAEKLGAHSTINYTATPDFAAAVHHAYPEGVSVYIETSGNPTVWREALRTIRRRGRVVVGGSHAGPIVDLDLLWLFRSRVAIMGSAGASSAGFAEMVELAGRGVIVPHIDSVRPLDELPAALSRLMNRENQGKLVIEVARG